MEPETPATRAITAAGIPHRVVVTKRAGSVEEAAALQGIRRWPSPHDRRPTGRRRIPVRARARRPPLRLAETVPISGSGAHELPDAEEARAVTGYERYTITPFGSTRAWPVVVDATVMDQPLVSVGGRVRREPPRRPLDLVAGLDAEVADVSIDDR